MTDVSGMPADVQKELLRLFAVNQFRQWYGAANVARNHGYFVLPCPAEIWEPLKARDPQKAAYFRQLAIKRGMGDLLPN
jgi:hypothetical protein